MDSGISTVIAADRGPKFRSRGTLMSRIATAALLMGAIAQPLAGQETQQDPVVIEPSGKWVVHHGDDRCRAMRIFGSGDEKSVLVIQQLHPLVDPVWIVAGYATRNARDPRKYKVQFGPSRQPIQLERDVSATFGDYGESLSGDGFDPPPADEEDKVQLTSLRLPAERPTPLDPAAGGQIEWIEVTGNHRPARRLATGKLSSLFSIMNQCVDAMIESWGLDPAVERTLSRPALPNNYPTLSRVISRNYPVGPERAGVQANVQIRVMVDASGRASGCTTILMSNSKGFDDEACRSVMRVGRFDPALDARGQPVASVWLIGISYRLG